MAAAPAKKSRSETRVSTGVGTAAPEVGLVRTGLGLTCAFKSGQGRGRTADLPIFSRTLVPTELPGQAPLLVREAGDPDGTRTRDLRRDRAAR